MKNRFIPGRRKLLGAGAGLTAVGLVGQRMSWIERAHAAELLPESLAPWSSTKVGFDASGKLVYRSDSEGNGSVKGLSI